MIAMILATLFTALLLPKDLWHTCTKVHACDALPNAATSAMVKASCDICDTAIPAFQAGEVLGPIRKIELRCADLPTCEQVEVFGTRAYALLRGPPARV